MLVGVRRSLPYRRLGNDVSEAIVKCWYVPPDVTAQISEPLANILDRYLPQKAKEATEVALDPLDVLGGVYSVMVQCKANEEAVVARILAARSSGRMNPQAKEPAPDPGMEAPEIDVEQLRDQAADVSTLEEVAA